MTPKRTKTRLYVSAFPDDDPRLQEAGLIRVTVAASREPERVFVAVEYPAMTLCGMRVTCGDEGRLLYDFPTRMTPAGKIVRHYSVRNRELDAYTPIVRDLWDRLRQAEEAIEP